MGLTETIYEGLRDEITTGQLKPGEVLSRRQIAARYGSSYTPVIAALVRLENVGLIESESSQMARVRRISLETIENDYVLREAYETQAIRLACGTATDREIEELYRRAQQLDDCVSQLDRNDRESLLLHGKFHKRIAEISRSPALVRALEHTELLRLLQSNWIVVQDPHEPLRYHSLLVDAIRNRDPQAADELMRAHVQSGLERELAGYRRSLHE
jgi:DNA-binding GntR family transcriptional regulator